MKYEKHILLVLLMLVIMGFLFSIEGISESIPEIAAKSSNNNKEVSSSNTPSFKSIDSGSTNNGEVSVELTPIGMKDEKLAVKISVNTHSVDLSQFDLKQLTTLRYNEKTAKPVSAPILSGHHSDGLLAFEVDEWVTEFTIKIKDIPKIEERIFTWP